MGEEGDGMISQVGLPQEKIELLSGLPGDEALNALYATITKSMIKALRKEQDKGVPITDELVGRLFMASLKWLDLVLDDVRRWRDEHPEA
jgi:hypothetical protein